MEAVRYIIIIIFILGIPFEVPPCDQWCISGPVPAMGFVVDRWPSSLAASLPKLIGVLGLAALIAQRSSRRILLSSGLGSKHHLSHSVPERQRSISGSRHWKCFSETRLSFGLMSSGLDVDRPR